jgi:hypothetical protein
MFLFYAVSINAKFALKLCSAASPVKSQDIINPGLPDVSSFPIPVT